MKFQLPFRPAAWLFLAACALGFSCQLKKYEDVGCPTAAAFRVENDGCAGPCNITVINETIGDDNLLSYDWNFGDSTTSTEKNPPAHFYNQFGNYFITLKVSMANCGTLEKTIKVSIKDPGHPLPVAAFSMDKTVVSVGETVQFTNASTEETAWHWSFGDGTTSELENPAHAYATADTFKVVLIAEGLGGFDTVTQEVRVRPKMWVKTHDLNPDQAQLEEVRCVVQKSDGSFMCAFSAGNLVNTANLAAASGNIVGTAMSIDLPGFSGRAITGSTKIGDGQILTGSAVADGVNDKEAYAIRLKKADFSAAANKTFFPSSNNGKEAVRDVAEGDNGDLVFCGNRTSIGMLFIKTNSSLESPVFKTLFAANSNSRAIAILRVAGGYAVVGDSGDEGVFFRLNDNLDLVPGSTISLGGGFAPYDFLKTANGFLVVGQVGSSSKIIGLNGSGATNGLSIDLPNVFLNRGIVTTDGKIAVVGLSIVNSATGAGFLAKYDLTSGLAAWPPREFALTGGAREFLCIEQLADNGFLIGGYQSLSGANEALIVRTDTEGLTN